jgi:hypothetical protein
LGPVEDRDVPALIIDYSDAVQTPSSLRNAFTTHAQHIRDEFLRHDQLIGLQAIQTQ